MHMDPIMPTLVATLFGVVALALALRWMRLPSAVAYVLGGVALGPVGLGWLDEQDQLARLGEIGIVLLLFFVGMEISLERLLKSWKVPLIGTLLQVAISVGSALAVGAFEGWPHTRGLMLGFVISLSSTAVVVDLLRQRRALDSPLGNDIIGILLVQDLLVIPMLVILGASGGGATDHGQLALQVGGGLVFVLGFIKVVNMGQLDLPWLEHVRNDPEISLFVALLICLGFAFGSALMGLSTALGAFAAGIIMNAARQVDWAHQRLDSFRILLMAAFFLSIGMLIDVGVIVRNWQAVVALTVAAFVSNTVINTGILRALGRPWAQSLHGGAVLSQIGEFSFVLSAVGLASGIITETTYQLTVAVIALTLTLSSTWIAVIGLATSRFHGGDQNHG